MYGNKAKKNNFKFLKKKEEIRIEFSHEINLKVISAYHLQ
jgi:hypothetical protein